jgi:hypothetical protein
MTRPGDQAGQVQAVQQIINTSQREFGPELAGENLLSFFGPQSANPIGGRGVGQKPRFERLALSRR